MTDGIADASPRRTARIAGVSYAIVVAADSCSLAVRSALIVRGDAAATATNIPASEPPYRLGVAADLVATACCVGATVVLSALFRPMSRTIDVLAAFVGFAHGADCAAVSLSLRRRQHSQWPAPRQARQAANST